LATHYADLLETEVAKNRLHTAVVVKQRQEIDYLESEDQFKFHLVVSNFNLQTNGSLEKALKGVSNSLAPDGAFVGIVPGVDTLRQLRNCFYMAENERFGGFEERMVVLPEPASFGNLLNKIEFQMASISTEKVTLQFENAMDVISSIKEWGMGGISVESPARTSRHFFEAVSAIYSSFYDSKVHRGKVDADFQLLKFIGYKQAEGQISKPRREFSVVTFKDFLEEHDFGEEGESIKFGFITGEGTMQEVPVQRKSKGTGDSGKNGNKRDLN